jgi:protein-tyrosine phosphatase
MPRPAGIDVVVSALTPCEVEELGLNAEAQECARNGLTFISFPIEDRLVPTSHPEFAALVDRLMEYLKNGKAIAVHCRAGIGRSPLIAVCLLVKDGLSTECAFRALEESRGCPVRTLLNSGNGFNRLLRD